MSSKGSAVSCNSDFDFRDVFWRNDLANGLNEGLSVLNIKIIELKYASGVAEEECSKLGLELTGPGRRKADSEPTPSGTGDR